MSASYYLRDYLKQEKKPAHMGKENKPTNTYYILKILSCNRSDEAENALDVSGIIPISRV